MKIIAKAALATLVRNGLISRQLAESRSSTPEELNRLMGGELLGTGRRVAA